MKFRPFDSKDAPACFRLRANAFILKFLGELTPKEVAASINEYLPEDYQRLARAHPCFVVEEGGQVMGFFTLKRHDRQTAELPLIYFDLNRLGRGLGTASIGYLEKWLAANWPEVRTLVVTTVIPKYNSGFYRKMGFVPDGEDCCEFGGLKVKALRLVKPLAQPQSRGSSQT